MKQVLFQDIIGEGFYPTVDDYSSDPLVPADPVLVFKAGDFNPLPTIVGVCKDEGALFAPSLVADMDRMYREWKNVAAAIFYLKGGNLLTKEQEADVNIMRR